MKIPLHERTLGELLRVKAERNGERTFLSYGGEAYTYRDADTLSNRLANGLLATGVRAGQHVAIMLENRPEVLWLHFALAKIGAVAVPINNAAKGDLLAYYVSQSDAVALVLEPEFVERYRAVHERCPMIERIVLFEEPGQPATNVEFARVPTLRYAEVAAGADTRPAVPVRFDDILHILYSSGTTGPSKGTMVTHATAIAVGCKYVETNKYQPDDVLYTCLPLFHGNAMNCTVLPALLAGARVALSRRFSARAFWDEVRDSGATQFTLLSAMTNILWMKPETPDDRNHRVRMCQVIPTPEFFHEFERRYNVRITSLYSLSDFGMGAMYGPDDRRDKWRSAGRVIPEMSVAIMDDDDQPLPTGTIGEICMRNNDPWWARQGYYKMADAYAKACRNLWFHTGDRGYLDADGYLYFVDRKKDVIRRRGENISPVEVEQVIMKHPAVEDVAVFPVRSEMSEDEVMATVVCRAGMALDPAALIGHCEPSMAYFMIPRYVEFAAGLPRTPSGKVEKYKLRAAAETRLDAIWDRERAGIVLRR